MKKNGSLADYLSDEESALLVFGTNHSDEIALSGGGAQHVLAGNGDDLVMAGGGPDTIEGQNGNDTILGGGGPDTAYSGNGNDVIQGGGGPDQLFGGNGDDILDGGAAADILTGGHGADIFVYTAHADESGGHEDPGQKDDGHDAATEVITDFKAGVDKIDLRSLEELQTFSFEATEHAVWVQQDGDNTIVRVDTNGDLTGEHAAELTITLLDVEASHVSANDFLI